MIGLVENIALLLELVESYFVIDGVRSNLQLLKNVPGSSVLTDRVGFNLGSKSEKSKITFQLSDFEEAMSMGCSYFSHL